jgi:hypothetical protein
MVNILESSSLYCAYYQANIKRELCWFFTASLRSCEYISFDRTINPEKNLFEFFVIPQSEELFLTLMSYFQKEGIVDNLVKLSNRLQDSTQQV